MNKALGFTDIVFSVGAGIFFLGYFLFEVPSNVILERVGAKRWIFRIMLSWGLISGAMAFARGLSSFYALRFLLGAAEAGFFPGMVLYLTYWFPASYRGRFVAAFMAAIPLANIVGAPISGLVLDMNGVGGLAGWQWLFIIEGVPACMLSVIVLAWLPDGPATASFLSQGEKEFIVAKLKAEKPRAQQSLWRALRDVRVLLLSVVYFGIVMGLYGIGFWLPLIVNGMGFSHVATGFVVAVPYVVSMAAMIAWGRSSDASGERIWHVAVPAVLGAVGFLAAGLFNNHFAALVAITVGAVGVYSALAPFWSLPPAFLSGTAAAGGIALINSLGNLSGFLGPYLIGWLKTLTGGYGAGLAALAAGMIVAALVVLALAGALAPSVVPSSRPSP